ncbi:TetR/AcrR family transcriptional regulator [Aromatoleum bremense]|uniref:TetR family transcriptional regulator n=1 Tax=Aromatoleum bremense TaxID=76115 RepID=A0ABX1NYU9_9RHOO|nr:helix-turn-helix domain-containing protein [Aromatoleum bremense]NMG17196.1 TetR family transcriptional regulator [Aromatoleum bremense]QTQ30544.1 Transcriptional regulator, TetR family [Aromatoleum bremense]
MTNVTPQTTVVERSAVRREQVISAARKCFEREGLHAATMAHIAAEAGMGVGHNYHYFDSREGTQINDGFLLYLNLAQGAWRWTCT